MILNEVCDEKAKEQKVDSSEIFQISIDIV